MNQDQLNTIRASIELHLHNAHELHQPPKTADEASFTIATQLEKLLAVAESQDKAAAGPQVARRLAQIAAICISSIHALGHAVPPPNAPTAEQLAQAENRPGHEPHRNDNGQ